MNCPGCGEPLTGLATRCWANGDGCGWVKGKQAEKPKAKPVTVPDSEPRRLTFPWSELVSVNTRKGGMVGRLSKEYRDGLNAMKASAKTQATANRWPILTCPVRLDAEFHVPDRRKRDCGNYMKALEDSLKGSIYEDDSQVVEWHGYKMPVGKNPRAVLTVTAIEGRAAA